MVVEELIAKLGLKFTGASEAARFLKQLEKIKRELASLGKGTNISLGKGLNFGKSLRDLERMTAAMRRYRHEAERAARAGMGAVGASRVAMSRSPRQSALRSEVGGLRSGLGLGAAGAGYLVGDEISRATRKSISMERAMIEVGKATDTSGAALDAYREKVFRLSRDTGKPVLEIANMLADAGFSGRPQNELLRFTEFGAKAASAWGGMGTEEAGTALSEIGNIYAANQTEIERIGDQINTMADKSGSRERDLLEIVRRVGGTGMQSGMSTGDILGMGASLKERGVPTEIAASGMEAFLNFLKLGEEYSNGADEGIKALGTSSDKLRESFVKMPTATMLNFLSKLDSVTDPLKRAEVLTNIFGATRQDDVARMLGALAKMREHIAMINDEKNYKGSVEKQFGDLLKTDVSKIDRGKATADVLETQAGDVGKSGLAKGSDLFTSAVERVESGASPIERFIQSVVGYAEARAKADLAAENIFVKQTSFAWDFMKGMKIKANRVLFGEEGRRAEDISAARAYGAQMAGGSGPGTGTQFGGVADRLNWQASLARQPMPAPSLGSPGQRMNWMSQGADKAAGVTNTITNNNTASVSVSANGLGVKEAADMIAAKVKEAVSSAMAGMEARIGTSIAKGNSTPTAPAQVGP